MVTAHALRHTAASLAMSAGGNPKVVQRMLGHASAAMTRDVYADLFDSDLTSVAESVGNMWARRAVPTRIENNLPSWHRLGPFHIPLEAKLRSQRLSRARRAQR
jgi:Phage integrase family